MSLLTSNEKVRNPIVMIFLLDAFYPNANGMISDDGNFHLIYKSVRDRYCNKTGFSLKL